MKNLLKYCFILFTSISYGQCNLFGVVNDERNQPIPFAAVQLTTNTQEIQPVRTDQFGRFYFQGLPLGSYYITTKALYFQSFADSIQLDKENYLLSVTLKDSNELKKVDVNYQSKFDVQRMRVIDGVTLTHGKKT